MPTGPTWAVHLIRRKRRKAHVDMWMPKGCRGLTRAEVDDDLAFLRSLVPPRVSLPLDSELVNDSVVESVGASVVDSVGASLVEPVDAADIAVGATETVESIDAIGSTPVESVGVDGSSVDSFASEPIIATDVSNGNPHPTISAIVDLTKAISTRPVSPARPSYPTLSPATSPLKHNGHTNGHKNGQTIDGGPDGVAVDVEMKE